MNMEILNYLNKHQENSDSPVVLVLVVANKGSAPQIPGACMLVSSKGRVYGTVGGGTIEKLAIEHAASMLFQNKPTDFCTYDLQGTSAEDVSTGMLCGGSLSIYYERLIGPERLIVYGCGHIGEVLVPLAVQCGFFVLAIDERSEMTDPDRFSSCDNSDLVSLECCNPVEHAGDLEIKSTDSIVIMTHNHKYDAGVLKALTRRLKPDELPRYLGMIGSASKAGTVLTNLIRQGVSEKILNHVRTPVGLNIGGASPVEIAISIIAEILAVKHDTINNETVCTMRVKKN